MSYVDHWAQPTPDELVKEQRIVEALIGRTLGSYQIVALLGAGAMGKVYKAAQSSPLRGSRAQSGTSARVFEVVG